MCNGDGRLRGGVWGCGLGDCGDAVGLARGRRVRGFGVFRGLGLVRGGWVVQG